MIVLTANGGEGQTVVTGPLPSPLAVDDVIAVAAPCPAARAINAGSGVGGQAFTTCGVCGALMPSTAGPHPRDAVVLIPARVEMVVAHGDGFVVWWRRLVVRDGEAV